MTNFHIMIVDDEDDIVKLFSDWIKKDERTSWWTIKTFTDPVKALKDFNRNSPDMLLLDLKMGELSGLDFLEKADRNIIHNCCILIITAFGTIEAAEKGVQLGAYSYIDKPVKKPLLIRDVLAGKKWLEAKKEAEKLKIADAKRHLLSSLIQGFAHHIKGSFCSIRAIVEDIKPLSKGKTQKLLDEIITHTEEGLRKAEALFVYREATEQKIRHEKFRLKNVIKDIVQYYERSGRFGKESQTRIPSPSINYFIKNDELIGDDLILWYTLDFILDNAVDAICEEARSVSSGRSFIGTIKIIVTDLDDDKISIEIRDNGVGIPQKKLSKVKEPFFTTKRPKETTVAGSGLSICNVYMKMIGGDLIIQSDGPHKGVRVIINLLRVFHRSVRDGDGTEKEYF